MREAVGVTRDEFARACGAALSPWGAEDARFLVARRLVRPEAPGDFAAWQIVQVATIRQWTRPPLRLVHDAAANPGRIKAEWQRFQSRARAEAARVAAAFRPVSAVQRALQRPVPPEKDRAVAEFVAFLRRQDSQAVADWYEARGKQAATLDELYAMEQRRPRFQVQTLRAFLSSPPRDRRRARRAALAPEVRRAVRKAGLAPADLLRAWGDLLNLRDDHWGNRRIEDVIVEAARSTERVLWLIAPRTMREALGGERSRDRWISGMGGAGDRCPICGELLTATDRGQAVPLLPRSPRDPFVAVMGRRAHFACFAVHRKGLRQRLLMRTRLAAARMKSARARKKGGGRHGSTTRSR
jgi:hypothetical protein